MLFSMLFVFCTYRAHNLAKKQDKFGGKSEKSWVPQNPWNPLFASLIDGKIVRNIASSFASNIGKHIPSNISSNIADQGTLREIQQ